jgi:translation initiation factor 1
VSQGSSLSLDLSAASSQAVSKVVLQREKKGRGGKTVTRVRGLPSGELSAYATKLKKALGCGASVEDADVLLHGELVDRGAQWFEAQGVRRVVRGN